MKAYTTILPGILMAFLMGSMSPLLSQERPNLVFITADDLSAKRLGCYGNQVIRTPELDAFAREALTFNRAYCQVPQCAQSRNSIFLGVRPETSGLWKLKDQWREALPAAVSLQRHFQDNGYAIDEIGKLFDPRSGPRDYQLDNPGKPGSADEPILRLTKLARSDEPFALFIGFGEPHPVTWEAREKRAKYREYINLYDPSELELQGPVMWNENDEPETREALATAYGVISYLDHEVGRILKEIKALGIWDNTIVIFWCADHGFRLGEEAGGWAGERWGKWYPDETDARVPLLMRVPGTASMGKVTSGIVECIDMYQTLMELCALDAPPQELEGHSFAPLFDQPDRLWKEAAFTTYLTGMTARGLATQGYRLIRNGKEVELYDLEKDPRGMVNIAGENQATVDELTSVLEAGPDLDWIPALD